MRRFLIVVLLDFSRSFLMRFSVRLGQFFTKHRLIALRRLAVIGLKCAACRYCDSFGLFVWSRMLFTTVSDCCVYRGTYHILVCLFLVYFIISCQFFWTDTSFLSSVMVNPSSHNNPNDISEDVFIFGKMWIYLACFLWPGSCSVAMCDEYIMPPSVSIVI